MCLFIKYIKNVLWRLAKRLSYTEDARCLKVKRSPLSILKQPCLIHVHHMYTNATALCPTCNGCIILYTFQLINVFVVRSAAQLLPECEI